MPEASPSRLSKQTLHSLFINGLGKNVKDHSEITVAPLLVDLGVPFPLRIRAYIYNCTNPPGGRSPNEFKVQIILPGQLRGIRGTLDYSEGRMPVLAAYARVTDEVNGGVFVRWDPYKHKEFAYSANMQVQADTIIRALYEPVTTSCRGNGEIILAARPEHLAEALGIRVTNMLKEAVS